MPEIDIDMKQFHEFTVRIADDEADATAAAADDFAQAVAECRFIPNTQAATWKGGKPGAVFTDVSSATWTCQMRIGQDWENADSLVNFLFAHAGESLAFDFLPTTGGPTISAVIIIAPPEIGGAIDNWGETTITHGVQGKPTVTPAA